VAGQVKDHGVGALTALISGGAVALIGEIFKNAVTEGLKSGGVAFWLTMIAAALAMIVAYISSYNYSVIFRDYGLDSADDDERAVFDGLRARLAAGGRFIPVYNDLLTRGLDRVDRFFGDDDPAVKTLWPGAFGFKGAKPFWTAPAYDRCLLIALLYPLAVLFVVWGVSGEVGKAEAALLLPEGVHEWWRVMFLFALAIIAVGGYCLISTAKVGNARQFFVVLGAVFGAMLGANAVVGAGYSSIAVAFVLSGIGVSVGVGAVPFISALIGAFAGVLTLAFAFSDAPTFDSALAFALAFAFLFAVFVAGTHVNKAAHERQRLGAFLIAFSISYILLCYGFALWRGATDGWERAGPVFLFFGVLTIVNAPFDWLSVGLTRALLRLGVDMRGFWPVWLAMVDLIAATFLIILLAAAMVFAVDLFEVVGRTKFIDVDATLMALADPWQRGQTQYWWIYATLFSTLIPSVLNMTVAALSLMRGVPWFHKRVAAAMRPGKPMMEIHLSWMPGALALEVMLAAMAGLAFTLWWIFKAVPWLTRPVEWLIPMLRWVVGLV
jgi:hypothetical protein